MARNLLRAAFKPTAHDPPKEPNPKTIDALRTPPTLAAKVVTTPACCRAVAMGEAHWWLWFLADHLLRQQGQCSLC